MAGDDPVSYLTLLLVVVGIVWFVSAIPRRRKPW